MTEQTACQCPYYYGLISNHLRQISRKYVLVAIPNLGIIPDLLRPKKNVQPTNEGHLQSWDHTHFLNLAEKHCGLMLVDWGFDHVRIPILSNQIPKLFGQKFTVSLETGILRKIFPYQSASVIGLFKATEDKTGSASQTLATSNHAG